MNKSKLRVKFKNLRSQLSHDYVISHSNHIQNNFLKNLNNFLQNIAVSNPVFSLYQPILNEVRTNKIADYLINNNFSLTYPVITDSKNQEMKFFACESKDQFCYSKIFPNILEPYPKKPLTPDVIISPLISFDKSLNRIGMGKGFYDKALSKIRNHKDVFVIGLSYDMQMTNEKIDIDIFDQKLDAIVTENKLFLDQCQDLYL